MKRWFAIGTGALIAMLAITDTVRDFSPAGSFLYFTRRPRQLLWVSAIAVAGGLTALAFSRLTPHARRKAEIFGTGITAGCLIVGGSCFAYQVATLALQMHVWPSFVIDEGIIIPLGVGALLWIRFQWLRKREAHTSLTTPQ